MSIFNDRIEKIVAEKQPLLNRANATLNRIDDEKGRTLLQQVHFALNSNNLAELNHLSDPVKRYDKSLGLALKKYVKFCGFVEPRSTNKG